MTTHLEKVTITEKEKIMPPIKRLFISLGAFLLGSAFITAFYIGIFTWAQGWTYAAGQFSRDRWYVLPIILGFGILAALYTILRFRRLSQPLPPGRVGRSPP